MSKKIIMYVEDITTGHVQRLGMYDEIDDITILTSVFAPNERITFELEDYEERN